ncbi:hypothetical protein SKAU_G00230750 [Synaphobranchus kaupii]|uniref:Poly [ADP-ribose] polymerase n=1 Tax=Synaphobranchus kaupii TaxID=118154 RepID=A0A9Q1F605_SYNKA|nr:hypothetical protein SKAU_G00230750 [Synaphobranchus kaupii]
MSVQLYDEREAEKRLDPRRFILSGFSEDCKCSHLSVFIKSCSKGAEHSWEVLNDGNRIAVTFKQNIDIQAFLKKCSSKKLQNMDISASRLEYTDSVLVEGNMENISEEALRIYFCSTQNNGGKVNCLIWVKKAKSALIVFEDFHVALRVAKEKHNICGVNLCGLLFYSSLQQALTGETPTMPPSPHKISIPVDALLLEYIQNDKVCKEEFESTLKELHTSIFFKGDPEFSQVVLEMAVDRESLLLHRLAHTWEGKTKQAVEALLEKYSIVTVMSTEEVWEKVGDKCLSLSLKTASVSYESAKNTVVVLGQRNDVKKLQGEIQRLLNKAKEELEVEKNTVERKILMDSKEKLDFVWNFVSDKLRGVEHLKDEANLIFHLKGLRDKVNAAEGIIKNIKDNLTTKMLHLSPHLAKFLQTLDLRKLERDHFTHISATVFSCGDSIQILAETQDGEKAKDKMNEILMEEVINLTPDQGKVTQEEQWKVFYSRLMQEVESSNNAWNVKISHSDVQITVCGFRNVVTDVARKLTGYLNNKMPVTKEIPLKSLRQVEYVDACMKLSESPEIKALDVTILLSRTQASPCLKVTAASDNIKEALSAVEKQISHIVHEKHIYSNAGESKVLEKHQDALKARAKEFACKLYLTVEQANQTSSHLACRFKMGDYLTLTIAQGEISQQTAEAVICPLGGNLSFDNPVAQKILQVGGPQIKDVCHKLLKEGQALVAGDVVAANPGNFPAKALFYAVIPSQTGIGKLLESMHLASAVEKSLQNAENSHCVSVVMPALGCGAFGFPVRESCKAIEKEISEFCDSHLDTPPHLREIIIVDPDDKTVEELHTVLKEMGYQSTDSINTTLSALPANKTKKGTPPPVLPKPGADLKVAIGGVRVIQKKGDITKETVDAIANSINISLNLDTVILKNGDITKEAVDAIVNSTNMSLNLDTGVSGAILKAAGKSVADECAKLGTQKADGVVVTGGGNLKCKHIIQMVGPTTTAGITTSIERVLQLCESKNTTAMSIPAIGTGKGNILPEESIKAILTGLQNHLSPTTSTSIKFIAIVAIEQKVFDCFCNYFEKNQQSHQIKAVTGFRWPSFRSRPKQLPANQVVIDGVTVILKNGDITKEAVDAIVNSTNMSLNLDTGTQKADGVVVTGGGDLKCKHIIQMVGPTTTAGITTSIERVLQLCESKNTTAMSIPAIGTGKGNILPEESIKAILTGLQSHLSQTTSTSIKFIFIVAFEQKVFDCFCNYFAERNQQPYQRKAVTGFRWPSFRSRLTQLPANQVKIHGIRIEVKKGDITIETVRGIVNTTNKELNLKGGVSGAIFRAAGSSVEEECKRFGPQQDDGVVVTSGGELHCDFIIHTVGPHTLAAATSNVEKILEQCEKNQITTVSFPAIGTGGGQMNAADVIKAMLQGFHNHLSQQISTVLKLIYIVVNQDKILQDFLQGLKQWSEPGLGSSCDEDDEDEDVEADEDWSTTSELDSADEDEDVDEDDYEGSIEIIMGSIKVKALCGDITKETTDAIVNSTNSSLDLSSGVSGAILKAAGQTVMDECMALGKQPSNGVVVTKPGNLKSKHIVHMVGQTKERAITNSMYKVLETCDRIKAQSISFPSLGTGAGNLAASQVANAMIDAINDFVLIKPKPSVTLIHIVIFQPKMMSDFKQVMKKLKTVTPKLGVAAAMAIPNLVTPSLESAAASITFPMMVAEVYGVSAANLAQVKKCLDDLVSEECTSQDVVDEHLQLLAETEKKDIVEASQRHQVHISMLRNKMTVSGKRDDVFLAVLQIKDSLLRARDREYREREQSRIWETIRWEVGRSDAWIGLDQHTSNNLELAYLRKDKFYVYQHQRDSFKVDFEKMQQIDSRGNITRIKRHQNLSDSETAIIRIPPTWTKMDGKDLDMIVLSEMSNEFQNISKEFVQSCQVFAQKNRKNIEVVQIQRIQHQGQWRRYTVSKQALDKKYPKNNNEQFLYHGSTKDICQKIYENGFNRSFCGRNATKFGNGTYFAKEAYYSCENYYTNPDEQGHKYIFRTRVLTGKPCVGLEGMREPAPVDPNNLQAGLHDCAVDNLQNPFIFVIFSDSGAYPEYLITFKTV